MKKIFLCGPMSGLPDNNCPAFRAKAAELRAQGYHVEDPSENQLPPDTEPGTEWEEYMRISIRQMLTCEEICLLPGWEKSRGALIEFSILSMVTDCDNGRNASFCLRQYIELIPIDGDFTDGILVRRKK